MTNWQTIIQGCKQGDAASQEKLYRLLYAQMMRLCMRYSSQQADVAGDLYNRSMLKVFRNLSQFKNTGQFEAWVRRIVVHTCIDHCRLGVKFSHAEDLGNVPDFVLPDAYHRIGSSEILKLVNALPKNTALVFQLFVHEGYSHTEIGEILGIRTGTSKWHMNEARRILREKIDQIIKSERLANAI